MRKDTDRYLSCGENGQIKGEHVFVASVLILPVVLAAAVAFYPTYTGKKTVNPELPTPTPVLRSLNNQV